MAQNIVMVELICKTIKKKLSYQIKSLILPYTFAPQLQASGSF